MSKKTIKKDQVIEFDPTKQYQWQSDEKIVLTGAEFEVIYKALTSFSSGDATNIPSIVGIIMATNVAQSKLAEYVRNGTFTEAKPVPQS